MHRPYPFPAAQKTARRGSKVHGVGQLPGNPRLCFKCRQPILEFDLWTKYTSPADPPGYAVYSIIFHQRCDGVRMTTIVKDTARHTDAHDSMKG